MSSPPYGKTKFAYRSIRLKEQHPQIAAQIAREFELSPVSARILAARGFRPDGRLKNYLAPTLKEGLEEPGKLRNLDRACRLIAETAKAERAIAICCDFDVDGLSGGAQLHHFLRTAGINSRVFVPDRFLDGYGLNENMIRQIASEKFGLMVTIDYGTRNEKELILAHELGLKTLVIDHHHVGSTEVPADVFVNPAQKGCGFAEEVLCASGLTWYLLTGLVKALPEGKGIDVKSYLDLACLGTICDMVPLVGVNRVIARRGLEFLGITKRPGLCSLKNVSGIGREVNSSHVSFGLGPRLNAAGRMVNAQMVIDLLTTEDSDLAGRLARKLNGYNLERQETESQIKEMAIQRVNSGGKLLAGIVLWDPDYHTGVIGLAAQRLVEAFYRPAVVLGKDNDGTYKGSVRGIKGFNVIEALEAVKEHLIKCGGHEGAGGLSIEEARLEEFAEAFVRECSHRLKHIETEPYAEADTKAGLPDITLELLKEFETFAPFGVGNPGPALLIEDLKVSDVRTLKNTHLKVSLSDGRKSIAGLMWRQTHHPALEQGARVNIVCKPDQSVFNGMIELQANLLAVEKAA